MAQPRPCLGAQGPSGTGVARPSAASPHSGLRTLSADSLQHWPCPPTSHGSVLELPTRGRTGTERTNRPRTQRARLAWCSAPEGGGFHVPAHTGGGA